MKFAMMAEVAGTVQVVLQILLDFADIPCGTWANVKVSTNPSRCQGDIRHFELKVLPSQV